MTDNEMKALRHKDVTYDGKPYRVYHIVLASQSKYPGILLGVPGSETVRWIEGEKLDRIKLQRRFPRNIHANLSL